MKRSYSNQPTEYNEQRLAKAKPIEKAITGLGLPLIRFRKLNGILNALLMQIEDGGDSPVVNLLLMDALKAAVRHQVGEDRAGPVDSAIARFVETEGYKL